MRCNLYYDGQHYRIDSYGNGLSYVVYRKCDGQSFGLNGDDADQFHSELEATHERWTYDDVIDQYSELFSAD